MKLSAPLIGAVVFVLIACSSAPAATPTLAPPASATAAATPTAAATSTLAATPTSPVSQPPSPSTTSSTSATACDKVLTEADVPGWTQSFKKELTLTQPGLIGGTQVGFKTAIGDSVSNSVACYDSASNAMAGYEQWDSERFGGEAPQDVPITETIGDSVKVVFCPSQPTVTQQLALITLVGNNVVSIAANGKTYPPTEDSVAVLVRLANAVLAHLAS